MEQDTINHIWRHDVLILQIGKSFSKCFGLKMFLDDGVYTKLMLGDTPVVPGARQDYIPTEEETREYKNAGDKIVDYELFTDKRNCILYNIHHGHNGFDWKIRYDELVPMFCWELTTEQEQILGYACTKAIGSYGGRDWEVWFTSDIPCNDGPWKFSGLPGLILQVRDLNNQFKFQCIGVEKRNEAVCLYDVPTSVVTARKYKQYERNMYNAPAEILGNGADWKFYCNGVELGADWRIPYNPIELE